jgi:hypothetical protein
MSTNPGTAAGQIRLAALLRYFQTGDFGSFRRSCELAFGSNLPSAPYYCANLLLAAQIGGLCEVSVESGVTRWWCAAHDRDIDIHSLRPKQIGVSPEWFARQASGSIEPVITESDGTPLLLGVQQETPQCSSSGIFTMGLHGLIPRFKALDSEVCETVSTAAEFPGRIEAYRPDTGSWEHSAIDMTHGAQLLKAQREYYGVSFYVRNVSLGLRVKIRDPSWAFVVAFFLLGWPLASLLRVDGTTLSFWRTVKLPAVISRLLFANARSLRIGPRIIFEDVHPDCIDGVLAYFGTNRGEE